MLSINSVWKLELLRRGDGCGGCEEREERGAPSQESEFFNRIFPVFHVEPRGEERAREKELTIGPSPSPVTNCYQPDADAFFGLARLMFCTRNLGGADLAQRQMMMMWFH